MNRLYEYTSEDGRRYTTLVLHAPGERSGETEQPWKGIHPPHGRHWAYVHSQLDSFEQEDRIEWSESGNPRLIKYADEDLGNIIQDIWTMKDPQYVIYPTEKNSQVLERIILSTSPPGSSSVTPAWVPEADLCQRKSANRKHKKRDTKKRFSPLTVFPHTYMRRTRHMQICPGVCFAEFSRYMWRCLPLGVQMPAPSCASC